MTVHPMEQLEKKVGYRFKRPDLLREALTHKSHASEHKLEPDNERLEFLGDSVLAVVVARELFERYPDASEGRLSKLKSLLVSRPSLTRWAKELDLGPHLFLGTGEESTGGRTRASILANAVEAVLGALYLDGGLPPAASMIREFLERQHDTLEETDHKSRLQEIMQKKHKVPPTYDLTRTTGPDHDKTFHVKVWMGRKILGSGKGKSKKEAEQAAAADALRKLEGR